MKTTLSILFCLCSLAAAAQSSPTIGYYINASGDTVAATIQDENWIRNPEQIRVEEQSGSRTIYLHEMQGFGLASGDVFRKFIVDVDVDVSPTDLNQMEPNEPQRMKRDTVLLRVLVVGAANLYTLNDRNGKLHYYIGKPGEEPRELVYRKALLNINNRTVTKTFESYKGILFLYLQDCGFTEQELHKVPFREQNLMQTIKKYNACKEPAAQEEYVATQSKTTFRFGAVAGIGAASFTFSGDESFSELTQSDFSSTGPVAGLVFDVVLPRGFGRWGLSNEVLYKPYRFEADYRESQGNDYSMYRTEFDLSYISLNTQVVYTIIGNAKLRPFLSAGIALNHLLSENSRQQSTVMRYGIERDYDKPALEEFRRLEQSLLLGAGINYKQFVLQARYERGNGFSP